MWFSIQHHKCTNKDQADEKLKSQEILPIIWIENINI